MPDAPPSPAPGLLAFLTTVDRVALWSVALDAPGAAGLLPPTSADLADADRLAFPRDRQRLLAGRAAVRLALAAALGARGEEVTPGREATGRPRLAGGPHFSFSRSGSTGLVAVGGPRPIGVDLERLRPLPEAAALAARHLPAAEQARWREEGGGAEPFLRAWTRHEARLKALGLGLAAAEGAVVPGGVEVRDLDLLAGHAAALALGPASTG